jgi:hypothetical protein
VRDFDPGKAPFDKVFAININVFWTTPASEKLAQIRTALDREGRIIVFYDTPSAARARQVITQVVDALRANGFAEPRGALLRRACRAAHRPERAKASPETLAGRLCSLR